MAASMTATFPAGHSSTNGIRVAQENRTHDKVPQVAVDDTLLTVDDLVRRRARTVGQEIIVSYPSKGIDYVDYTMQQLDVFAYRVARHYEDKLPVRSSSDDKPMVVAILGPSNLEYLITILALMKLGHTTLFLSTRISQEAVDSLLKATGAKALLVDTRYSGAANSAVKPLPRLQCIEIAPRLVFEFPVDTHIDTRLDGGLDHEIETSNNVYIIHSSGSTGLPKPIYQTHKAALVNYSLNMDMRAFITLPLYHNHGICNVFRAIHSGKSIHIYNAELPLASHYLETILGNHGFEIFYGVPYALKLLAETKTGITLLRQLEIVMYGGSACPDELGDMLVKKGVNLVGHYGATEVGQLMTSFRPPGDKAWNYVRETAKLSKFVRWIPRGSGLFECCVLDGWPAKLTSNQPDHSYNTKDLFEPHPTIPKAWKYIARLDDTIVLVNGEKFNPVQMEGRIRTDSWVTEVVVFGSGRPNLGLLVVPAPSTARLSRAQILDHIWPILESANQCAEAYARVSKNMIGILDHDCQYPRTDKGSVIRQAFYRTFAKEINEIYDAADSVSSLTKSMDPNELRIFLRSALLEIMGKHLLVQDDTDFFSLGMDSLQAIQLRSEILRHVDIAGRKPRMNVVFDYSSISKLSVYLGQLEEGEEVEATSAAEEMKSLVEKYTSSFEVPVRRRSSIVVTGATGSLGAHVIALLSQDPSVKDIYCLVRAKDNRHATSRVRDSLLVRKVYHSLPLESRHKLHAVPFDQSDKRLGLSDKTYWDVANNLRAVIHCAWAVNFNLHLSSFERDCVAGVVNLLSLCLAADSTSPATFNFCSSVSAVAQFPGIEVPETLPDFSWAQEMGYAQSKSVAEHICIRAAEARGIKARVLRVGQIIADRQHGIWNASEGIPMILQTALTVGALPRLREEPSWLPVDIVAQAILDISLSSADTLVTNVANRRTFSWVEDLIPALRAAGLRFEDVEPKEWIRRLGVSNPDPAVNPPIKLVDFFASKYDKDEFAASKMYATKKACELSSALANASVLDRALVKKFVHRFCTTTWKLSSSLGNDHSTTPRKTAVILAGPCGSGKTTIGENVAQWLGGVFIEGDSLHTHDAVERMRRCQPLTDYDRYAWLDRIRSHVKEAVHVLGHDVVVVSCSALRKKYRDLLRKLREEPVLGGRHLEAVEILIVDLQARQEVIMQRVVQRKDHYMTANMVSGQVGDHEAIQVEEDDVMPVNAEGTPEEVLEEVRWVIGKCLRRE